MRKFPAIVLAVLLSAPLPACVSTGGGSHTSALGPDTPTITESAGNAVSTLVSRLKAGIIWLWATYTRLHDAGVIPDTDDLRADIVDMEAAFGRGDLSAALDLYSRARARVTKISEATGK